MERFSTVDCVFVYGALRSGTTVFRLMLDHHPDIANPGEMDFLFDYLHESNSEPTGWFYDTEGLKLDRIFNSNKLTIPSTKAGLDILEDFLLQINAKHGGKRVMSINIHRHIDKVFKIFPNTKCIHMLRDPRDVARSSIGMGWAYNIYYGVRHWVKTEQAWDSGIANVPPASYTTLRYEDLFMDIDSELRRVCDFLSVEWSANMLNYHENSTYSEPDPSLIWQWKRKCSAEDIALLEGYASGIMQKKGYEPSTKGRKPSFFESIKMLIKQKQFLWNIGFERYGWKLFLGEKFTRLVKLNKKHQSIRLKLNDIDQLLVK